VDGTATVRFTRSVAHQLLPQNKRTAINMPSNLGLERNEALLAENKRLRQEILELKRQHVYKSGLLKRRRETMLTFGSGVWQPRYFEVRLGNLLCFKSMLDRAKRFELPLVDMGTKQQVALTKGSDSSENYIITIVLPSSWRLPDGGTPAFRSLQLAAKTEEERNDWLNAMSESVRDAQAVLAGPDSPKKKKRERRVRNTTRPIHTISRPSLLSSEHPTPPNLRGFFNLLGVIALASNFRLIVENFLKYGLLFSSVNLSGFVKTNDLDCVGCFFFLWLSAFTAFWIEKLASRKQLGKAASTSLHGMNCCLCIAVPLGVTSHTRASPIIAATVLSMAVVFFMKIVSYSHTNHELREIHLSKVKDSAQDLTSLLTPNISERDRSFSRDDAGPVELANVSYPDNLTVKDVVLFMWFPTLVYQTAYPRSKTIRRQWLFKRFMELLCCLGFMFVVHFQFIVPTLSNARHAIELGDPWKLTERLLKLAIPSVAAWLCMFYALFHLWLNILAEVLYFGDRLFYTHWWNATRMDEYWRCWNIPVHNWLLRHLYTPAMNTGMSKRTAGLAVFVVSAILHELIASGACHSLRIWAFLGMMAQAPAIALTFYLDKHFFKGSQIGNVLFWLTFCIVGQPMLVMAYYWDLTGPTGSL
jgi:diacylglycerol O-acyltransferase 1